MDAVRQGGSSDPPGAAASIADAKRGLGSVPFARALVTGLLLALAVVVARFSWDLPMSSFAERVAFDVRSLQAAMHRPAAQDPRILLVVYTPATQEATGKRSPLDRAILARALANLDRLRAKAVGIDILIDQPQPEDDALRSTLRAMRTPTWLAYASAAHNGADMQPWQQARLDALFRDLRGSRVRPASIHLEADGDNAIRSWPRTPRDLPPFLPQALAGNSNGAHYDGSIRYRMPADPERQVFLSLPIDLFAQPETAAALADQVRGRIVLIGGDLPDSDRFVTPEGRLANPDTAFGRQFRENIPGLEVHATMLAQLLDTRMPTPTGASGLWLLAFLVVLAGAFTAMLDVRPWVLGVILGGEMAFFIATPFWLQNIGVDTRDLPAVGWVAGWLLAFMATEAAVRALSSEQRRFAQAALGKYLPRDIAAEILRDPDKLSLTGEKRAIFALFTDLEGFTRLSHRLRPEEVAPLLNAYLDGMCEIVLRHGGTIDKFVGDAIVALWGAPIARDDDGERAANAMLEMVAFARDFSTRGDQAAVRLGRTRVGVHYGEAIVGNFGGRDRFQYTALGDVMNAAARLESANKALKTAGLISATALERSNSDAFRPMGRVTLAGRSTPIEVWEPAPDMPFADRRALAQAWTAFDAGDLSALNTLHALTARYPDDAALQFFVYRLEDCGPGRHFELREK
ncbi:adenylate/guanylate cyclase domain-containing protein [Sphingomonas sp. BN140010]|uniref:Adenylate/guanylate cyclase domain-containing protein n=1 Tax=Sphingomonas arvum TaxID=2992113 RepID=A0ABT3JHN9_9SPHN|nr:adenylate/guanylate cyclase domain-containing protein [Sphingomonas sp. BN140010]MCW3798582.1 adenylate/guanylate cyclase domain-containing protein [Sphingomonas sp. BN140010]